MDKRVFFCAVLILALLAGGCASTSKVKQAEEIGKLNAQVQQLENEIKLKDKKQRETERQLESEMTLRKSLEARLREVETSAVMASIEPGKKLSKETIAQIQTALKNAGFNPGTADGVMGEKTKKAIIDFQKANGLEPDGVVGRKTWAKLQNFLP